MATLVFTAFGALAGPLGAAIGGLVGQQVDHALFSPRREGPRLKELMVTTSSYGTPIARQHGRIRAGGSLIWATELAESSESAGGKGGSVTTYSYSCSFAVALSSRPLLGIGRIWADGNLLRGEAGDLKVGGTMRLYRGFGDHAVDPLIASDKGSGCPAFRRTAYAVFEDLQLADFGNRIPALSFEVIADDGAVSLLDIADGLDEPLVVTRALPGMAGFAFEGGPLSDVLAVLDDAWPIGVDAGDRLSLFAADDLPGDIPLLPEPAAAKGEGSFGAAAGSRKTRKAGDSAIPDSLRYYDRERDYLTGMQRADGRARPGQGATIELPATLSAASARTLIDAAADRAGCARELLEWRLAELDPALSPGTVVRVPGHAGNWRILGWEWNDEGVTLELGRMPRGPARQPVADAGSVLSPRDDPATPTLLRAFELPWDGMGAGDVPAIYAAPSSVGGGWSGAALYAERGGGLSPLGGSGSRRSVIGAAVAAVGGSAALLLERDAKITVQLVSEDFALIGTTPEALANGANRALLGGELLQFVHAVALGGGQWQLEGLLRGRGGTERAAREGHAAGTPFVLLDHAPIRLDAAKIGLSKDAAIVALGLADPEPVTEPIANPGATLRPLIPVHPRVEPEGDGLRLSWTRRARGGWGWPDEVDLPLAEPAEAYRVGLGPVDSPAVMWDVAAPTLTVAAGTLASLAGAHPGAQLWVRQIGGASLSDALLLHTLP
ncbi:MAG: phage tail protein [Candidatus Andeanibacterium colombiense]|uniref:Phage tail protein n=1 Tax=Candidatus Andeanibacterium colombiense TaxID=3121345 RepID=A0AAJ6BN66_9SPHN|nr:MAG: phage tail protein [Sphingomonadaceae bacterium]